MMAEIMNAQSCRSLERRSMLPSRRRRHHGATNIGRLQSRTVAGSVSDTSDDLLQSLERLDEDLLVLW